MLFIELHLAAMKTSLDPIYSFTLIVGVVLLFWLRNIELIISNVVILFFCSKLYTYIYLLVCSVFIN